MSDTEESEREYKEPSSPSHNHEKHDGKSEFPPTNSEIPELSRVDPSLLEPLQASHDETMDQFIEEYQKLQQALRKSHESENRFVMKCKGLSKEIRLLSQSVTAKSAQHQSDLKKRKQLKEDVETYKQQHMTITAEVAEKRLMIKELRGELKKLGEQLEDSSNDSIRQQRNTIARLELEVNKFTLIRDKDRAALTKIRSKNVDLFKQLQDVIASQSRSQQELDNLESKLLETRALSSKEMRRKTDLERAMKEIQNRVSDRQSQLASKKDLILKAQKDLAEVEAQLVKAEDVVETNRQQYNALSEEAKMLNEALIQTQQENEAAYETLKKSTKALEEERNLVKKAKNDADNKLRLLQALNEKLKILEEEVRHAEEEKLQVTAQMKLMKEQISNMQYKLNNNAKAMDTCVREREVLSQNHMAKVEAIHAKEAALRIKKATLKNIKNEHQGYLVSIRGLTKIIDDLRRDKAIHEADLQRRQLQKARALEEVAQRELKIAEFQQQIIVNEAKLRQQQNLLEAVRSDRNMYRKTLIEQQNEMHDYRRKFTTLQSQVTQLKTEIKDKDTAIVVEHFNLKHVEDDIKTLRNENRIHREKLDNAQQVIKTQSKQIRKLTTIIADADEELRVQMKQYNTIVNEQRVLNQQLIARNEELSSLYEQLKLQNSILSKGSSAYREKQLLLQELIVKRSELQKTLEEVEADIDKFAELKGTIGELQNQFIEEQLKVKALTDELRKPINIHRWRRLQDTNTDTYTMIKRVRHLQKAIITKAANVEQKDQAIQEREKLYVDLRRVLSRQPGNEAAEQLRLYHQTLVEKKAKLKAMSAELILYQTKVQEYKHDLNQLSADMNLLKLAYFQNRKKQQRMGKHIHESGGLHDAKDGGETITVGGQTIYLPPRDATITDYTPYSAAAQQAVQSLQQQQKQQQQQQSQPQPDIESHPINHHQQAYNDFQANLSSIQQPQHDDDDDDENVSNANDLHVDEALSRSESVASVS